MFFCFGLQGLTRPGGPTSVRPSRPGGRTSARNFNQGRRNAIEVIFVRRSLWDVSAGWWLAKRKDDHADIGLNGAGKAEPTLVEREAALRGR